jgi:hypothetical protein
MTEIRPTQERPEHYQETAHLDLNENRGLAMILNLVGVGLLFGMGWLLLESLAFLRPEYLAAENILIITGMREFWRGVLLLVVSVGLMIILNEVLRGLVIWAVTRKRPRFGFRGFFTYVPSNEWYIPRDDYIIIRLTPLVMITLLGLVAVPIVRLNLVPGVLLLISLNFAGATGDILTIWWLLQKPKDVLVEDYGDGVRVFSKAVDSVNEDVV